MKTPLYISVLGISCLIGLAGCDDAVQEHDPSIPAIEWVKPISIEAYSAIFAADITQADSWSYSVGESAYIELRSKGSNAAFQRIPCVSNHYDQTEKVSYDWYCSLEENDVALTPGETYEYKFTVTDGISSLESQMETFTTTSVMTIKSIAVENWDQTETTALSTTDEITLGAFLTNVQQEPLTAYRNNKIDFSTLKNNWWFNKDIQPNAAAGCTVHVYAPYRTSYNSESYTIPISLNNGSTDYLYGETTPIEPGVTEVSVVLKHALARICLNFSTEEDIDYEAFSIEINNCSESYPRISATGLLNLLTGNIEQTQSSDGYQRTYQLPVNKNQSQRIFFGVIPAQFNDDEVYLKFGRITACTQYFPASTWEAGKTYEYHVQIINNSLVIVPGEITAWSNHQQDEITIQ
jgi:hypothetical protein